MAFATWFVALFGSYAAAGLLFALPFVVSWVRRIDPMAGEAGWGFRLLILPGAVALWPLLAWRLLRVKRPGGAP